MNCKLSLIGIICAIAIISCKPPKVKEFTHRNTLFPLKGIHKGIHCRECHKDGAMTSLPTACVSCHPMGPSHTHNLGDCDLCHTPTTFATAFFNHRRAGVPMYGAHLALIGDGCFDCHETNTYTIPGGFSCLNCHNNTKQATYVGTWNDNYVHSAVAQECSQCHNQITFSGGRYAAHSSNPRSHGTSCSGCHTQPYQSLAQWQNPNIKYRDIPNAYTGVKLDQCGDCHVRNYDFGEDDHNGLPADYNCKTCHSTGGAWN